MVFVSRISAGPKLPIHPEITELNKTVASEVALYSVARFWLWWSSSRHETIHNSFPTSATTKVNLRGNMGELNSWETDTGLPSSQCDLNLFRPLVGFRHDGLVGHGLMSVYGTVKSCELSGYYY
jgi:hypothetical protein